MNTNISNTVYRPDNKYEARWVVPMPGDPVYVGDVPYNYGDIPTGPVTVSYTITASANYFDFDPSIDYSIVEE